jgi:hypothetical protein
LWKTEHWTMLRIHKVTPDILRLKQCQIKQLTESPSLPLSTPTRETEGLHRNTRTGITETDVSVSRIIPAVAYLCEQQS